MANVSLYYGTKAKLDETPYQDGAMYVCIDQGVLYTDVNDERIAIGGIHLLGADGVTAPYGVDTSISEEDESAEYQVPTTAAVQEYVNSKNVTPEIVCSDTAPTDSNVKI